MWHQGILPNEVSPFSFLISCDPSVIGGSSFSKASITNGVRFVKVSLDKQWVSY